MLFRFRSTENEDKYLRITRMGGMETVDAEIVKAVFEFAHDHGLAFADAMSALECRDYNCKLIDIPRADVILDWED